MSLQRRVVRGTGGCSYELYVDQLGCWNLTTPTSPGKRKLMEILLSTHICADVVFEINDEDPIFAHKCVLAAASDPMKALVTGAWLENQYKDGVCHVKASHSSLAINAMLKYIYNDTVALPKDMHMNVFYDIFDLAAQYELPGLATAYEAMGVKLLQFEELGVDLVVSMMVAAYVYDMKNLKRECVEYIQSKGPKITMSSAFIGMKDSYPEIWKKLRTDLGVPDEVV